MRTIKEERTERKKKKKKRKIEKKKKKEDDVHSRSSTFVVMSTIDCLPYSTSLSNCCVAPISA